MACVGAAVFFVPYLVPVTPSISLSYIAGFSNKTAAILFVLGVVAFAVFTRGEIAKTEEGDSALPVAALLVSSAIVLALCLMKMDASIHGHAGYTELEYALNRQELVAAGLRPYSQFEYIYGPFLLYPGYLIARLLHTSQAAGYYTSWIAQWLIGTVFMWLVVRELDLHLRFRLYVYAALFFIEIFAVQNLGVNYTPFRAYSGAFFVVVCYWVWRRTNDPWKMALASAVAVALGLMISMEAAVAVTIGVGGYFILLALRSRLASFWAAVCSFFVACGVCFAVAAHAGMFLSAGSFASGGFNFPLLPSISTCLILFVYVVAVAVLYRCLLLRNLDTVVIPLVLAGLKTLPSAMGRCDLGHLFSATPALVVGVAAILAMPTVRKWWVGLVLLVIYLAPAALLLRGKPLGHRIKHIFIQSHEAEPAAKENASTTSPLVSTKVLGSAPCDTQYYEPFDISWPTQVNVKCVDTGYYFGNELLSTPQQVDQKIQEMRERPHEPLLLSSESLEKQIAPDENETDMNVLRGFEGAYWVPRERNVPVTFKKIVTYVRSHYVPGPIVARGNMRIWYPIAR